MTARDKDFKVLMDNLAKIAKVIDVADILSVLAKYKNGTATITSAATEVTVTHGYGSTPTSAQVKVSPLTSLGTGAEFYVPEADIGATTFKIKVKSAPGADVKFTWSIL